MCGISGYINFGKSISNSSTILQKVKSMNYLIKHRGPDGDGLFIDNSVCFGHVRLSIIDLDERSSQPFHYLDRYIIVYNGEIYNFKELKKDLENKGYNFYTASDTEVIPAAFDCYGVSCVDKFNGMFSFAIYDKVTRFTYLFRDRLGIKPLYYSIDDSNGLWFCSEIKQLVCSDIVKPIVNDEAVREFLSFQYCLDGKTMFDGIESLLPGYYMTVTPTGDITHTQYWSVDSFDVDHNFNECFAVEQIRESLIQAVDIRRTSDVEISAYLSAGIDSTIITSLLSKKNPSIKTFTYKIDNDNLDESRIANSTSKKLGTTQVDIELSNFDILKTWKESIYFMDEPKVGFSLLPQYKLSHEVSKHVKVILGGHGADELFFGYSWHTSICHSFFSKNNDISFINKLIILKNTLIKADIFSKFSLVKRFFSREQPRDFYLNHLFKISCSDLLINPLPKSALESQIYSKNSMQAIRKFELKYWLQSLLHVEDRTSMSASIESRVPFIDYKLVEIALKCKPSLFIDGIVNKNILKKSFIELLPADIFNNKKKRGYVSPIKCWLNDPDVKKCIVEIFSNKNSFIFSYIKYGVDFKKISPRKIWLLVSLEIWHDTFFKDLT